MQSYPLQITAASPTATLQTHGNYVAYESASAVTGDGRIFVKSQNGNETILKAGQALRFEDNFDTLYVRSIDGTSAITANLIIGSGEFTDNNTTIASSTATITNFPATQNVAVIGTVAPTTNVLNTVTQIAPVTVGLAQVAALADATLRRATFRNASATGNIALGGTGVTIANSAIVLAPGDVWIEDNSAGAAWFAIADTAGLTLQISTAK